MELSCPDELDHPREFPVRVTQIGFRESWLLDQPLFRRFFYLIAWRGSLQEQARACVLWGPLPRGPAVQASLQMIVELIVHLILLRHLEG